MSSQYIWFESLHLVDSIYSRCHIFSTHKDKPGIKQLLNQSTVRKKVLKNVMLATILELEIYFEFTLGHLNILRLVSENNDFTLYAC